MRLLQVHNVSIRGISACVPKQTHKNVDLEGYEPEDLKKVIDTIGINERRVATSEMTTSAMSTSAGRTLLKDLNWSNAEIDLIVVVTQSPDHVIPGNSHIIQKELALRKDCVTIDLNQGCAGFIFGLYTISQMMSNGDHKRALLFVGDTITKYINPIDKGLKALFSDACTCTALEFNQSASALNFSLGSIGEKYKVISTLTDENNAVRLNMDGLEVFNFGLTEIVPSIEFLLGSIGREKEDINYLVLHQANRLLLENIRKRLKMEKLQVPYSIAEFGNTSSATIPLTMVQCLSEALANGVNRLVLCGFGVGLSWGVVYLETEGVVCSKLIEI